MGNYSIRVLEKIIVLFVVMIAGYIAKKTKICDGKNTKYMSSLLANITNPCLILATLQTERTPEKLKTAFYIILLSLAIHSTVAIASWIIFRKNKNPRRRSVYSFAMTYMNCGFMGYPIMMAIFGNEDGLFYGVIYTVIFNLFCWTHGVLIMDTEKKNGIDWKKMFNPCIISLITSVILYVTNIRLPIVLYDGIDMIGNMTFPLSMLIIGSLLADMKLKDILKDVNMYLFSLGKLIVLPLIFLIIAYLTRMPQLYALIGLTMCCTPTATNTAVLAEIYGNESQLAAKIVGVTTLLCIATMPFMLMLSQYVIK